MIKKQLYFDNYDYENNEDETLDIDEYEEEIDYEENEELDLNDDEEENDEYLKFTKEEINKENALNKELSYSDSKKLTKEEQEIYAKENMNLVYYVIKNLYPSKVDQEELYDVGCTGYAKALVSYDKTNGTKFSTYAYNCIRNEILFFLRKESKHNNNKSLNNVLYVDKNGNNLHVEDVVTADDKDKGLEEKILEDEQREILLKAISELNEKEQRIIIYRYGLDRGIKKTQNELAKEINMSQANVSKIQEKALRKLRTILKKYM